jgi:hypothetical protein
MVEKKLLTLAGVVGILACGACFLPPLPQHKPAPPQIRDGLVGVQSIRVEVVNTSPSQHLGSADLARKVTDAINQQSWKTKVNAHVGKEAGGEDAVLDIAILRETKEAKLPASNEETVFYIVDSATLTTTDSTLIWRETEAGNPIARNVVARDTEDVWKFPGLVDAVDKALSDRMVFRMFYGR